MGFAYHKLLPNAAVHLLSRSQVKLHLLKFQAGRIRFPLPDPVCFPS